ncbi:hypothetical protein [Rhodanobacter sp. OK091]|uniref:hypothetical protein n=1 Tax=Rhodanobacter sp. OK091 TaxID=1881037 RepID=UPI000921BDA4|nr:hypothetical protein [Rhodanobacter sp. OK091]SHM16369.1 hypothetical protein SAMN05428972_2652 [Rhodanobacter sp. OK091]
MNENAAEHDLSLLLDVLRPLSAQYGLHGEVVDIDGALIYQAPWLGDGDVTGVFIVTDPAYSQVQAYLTLPCRVGANGGRKAMDFVVRSGFGLRFGALEFDEDEGSLRVRTDAETTPEELAQSIPRLFERALELARKVSPPWQAICGRTEKASEEGHALRRYGF